MRAHLHDIRMRSDFAKFPCEKEIMRATIPCYIHVL